MIARCKSLCSGFEGREGKARGSVGGGARCGRGRGGGSMCGLDNGIQSAQLVLGGRGYIRVSEANSAS